MAEIDFDTDGVFPEEAPPVDTPEAASEPTFEVTEPVESPAPPSGPPKKGHGKGLRIAAIVLAAVVALGVVAAFAVPAIIKATNPKAAVLAALSKTMDNAGFGDAAAIASGLQKGAFEQTFSLRLGDQYPADLDTAYNFGQAPGRLSGTGFSYTIEMDRAAKKLAFNLGADLGTYHVGDIRFFADNNLLSFGSPELTGNKFYQFNTETFGADWNASPYWSTVEGVDPTWCFNLFDEVTAEKNPAVTPETATLLTQFATDLNKACPMIKEGDIYTLTVPADALQTYLKSTAQALEEDEAYAAAKPQGVDLPDPADLADLIGGDATVLFTVKGGAVTRMEAPIPITADGEKLLLRFVMEQDENGVLFFTLTGEDEDGEVEVSLTASPSVYTDKAAKQLSVDLPEIIFAADDEVLTIGTSFTMEPLNSFAFEPTDIVSFMELDQNGVLELLLGALGGLQSISEGISGY